MDLRQLRYFVSIVEAGSFTAASQQLRIAQPSLSQHVIALERELGVQLLQREPRGVRLTEPGSIFAEHALAVLRSVDRARESVSAQGARIQGRVAIGLPTTVAPVLAAPLLAAASRAIPDVTLHVVESHSGFLREWLDAERLDIALLFNVSDAEGLELTPIITEELYLISPRRVLGRKKQVALQDVVGLDLILAGQPHDLRRTLERAAFSIGGGRLLLKAEVDSLSTIKQMVALGLGHTVLPLSAVQQELASGTLKARRIVEPVLERNAAMAFVARRLKTRAQQVVAGLVLETVAGLIRTGAWIGQPRRATAGGAREHMRPGC